MLPDEAKDRIAKTFEQKSMRNALMVSGCIAAAQVFGGDPYMYVAGLHSGFLEAVRMFPLENAGHIATEVFRGSMSWFSVIALGAAEQIVAYGGEIPKYAAPIFDHMRQDIASTFNNSRELFTTLASKSAELASVWRGVIRDVTPDVVLDATKSMAEMIPRSPADAVKAFWSLTVKAIEGYGIAKSLQGAYKWAIGKFRKDIDQSPDADRQAADVGAPRETVTNLNINIALGGDEASERAVVQLKDILESTSGREINLKAGRSGSIRNSWSTGGRIIFSQSDSRKAPAVEQEPSGNVGAVSDREVSRAFVDAQRAAWTSVRLNSAIRKAVHERIAELKMGDGEEIWKPVELREVGVVRRPHRSASARAAAIARFVEQNEKHMREYGANAAITDSYHNSDVPRGPSGLS